MEMDYFAPSEFTACVPSCSKDQMDPDFMKRLNKARRIAGLPFVLNCAFRPVEWDKLKGRSGNSFHCKGRAVDIRCLSDANRAVIVAALIKVGFNGIGIASNFIHVDDRQIKTMWLYE